MLIGYARVSTSDQNLDRQVDELKKYGCEKIFEEKITGTKKDRLELNRLLEFARPEDTVVISELTRLSRSTKDLFEIVEMLQQKNINLKSLKESWLDTTSPQGKLMFTIFAGLSQFERDLISQRTKEGLKAARTRGRRGGRPNKQNEKKDIVLALYGQNFKISEIVKQTNLSRSTVNRIIQSNTANSQMGV